MRKFQVIRACVDKTTGKLLQPGAVLEVSEARAQELEKAQKYVTEITAPAPEEKPEETTEEQPKKAPTKKAGRRKKAE